MPLQGKKLEKAQKNLITWEYYVDSMDAIDLPKDHIAYKEMSKYGRFTGFLKDYLGSLLTSKRENSIFAKVNLDKDNVPENWWDIAMKVGNGKDIKNTIPQIKQPVSEEDKKTVLNTLLPAYRALTEKFEKRWSIEWIFNHDQYTAERDSIRAIRGVMMSVLGCSREDIDNALKQYVDDVPDTGRTAEERSDDSEEYRNERRGKLKYERYCERIAEKRGISVDEAKAQLRAEDKAATKYYERWNLEQQGLSESAIDILMEEDDEKEPVDKIRENANVDVNDIEEQPIFDPNKTMIIDDSVQIDKSLTNL